MTTNRLNSLTWLAWGVACMAPLLVARNPFVTAEVLIILLVTRAVWHQERGPIRSTWFLRLATVLVVISVAFNVLTVHAGERVIASLPQIWPVVGGDLTLNAALYGLVGALALLTLLVTGLTVGAMIDWTEIAHALPSRLRPIAATGSVAWSFLPQTTVAWRDIREAQVMRGRRFRAARDFVPIVVPLLAGGLERSLTMAEALEARGFGGQQTPASRGGVLGSSAMLSIGLLALATAAFSLAVGSPSLAIALGLIGVAGCWGGMRLAPATERSITRYRPTIWTQGDWLVIAVAPAVIAVVLWRAVTWPTSLAFDVYPTIVAPIVDPILLGAVALLLAPAALAASGTRR